jgi:hypothetical protein
MDRKKLVHKIGLDIDATLDATHTKKLIGKYRKQISRYIIFKSASGTGLHFEIYLTKPITIGNSFYLREKLGDDKKRLMFSKADYARGWDFDILFTYKKVLNKNRDFVWKKREFLEEVIFL